MANEHSVKKGNAYYWYDNDYRLHREDGPAIIWDDGSQHWYYRGFKHREDGPAIVGLNGFEAWWYEGERHREDGPAVIFANGRVEWWFLGEKYSFAEWIIKNTYISEKEKLALMLQYG